MLILAYNYLGKLLYLLISFGLIVTKAAILFNSLLKFVS